MRKKKNVFKSFALSLAFSAAAAPAIAKPVAPPLAPVVAAPAPIATEKRARNYGAIVIDAETGEALYARNANAQLHPASTTKLMTAFLVFEALEHGDFAREDKIKVSRRAAFTERNVTTGWNRHGYYQAVTEMTLDDALKVMMVHSANDAAIAIADALGGSTADFADMMNDAADRLGMSSSYFVNPNGLPADAQVVSVADMAKLAQAIVTRYPEDYAAYCGLETFTFNGHTYRNSNNMLGKYDGMDGLKTGWILSSGYNLAASATRGDHRVVAVVFGARSIRERTQDMTRLLDYGLDSLAAQDLAEKTLQTAAQDKPESAPPPKAPPAPPR
jgi:D-alanyl-D-alanine carboxypeptidase